MQSGNLQTLLGHPLFRTLPRSGRTRLAAVSRKRRFAPGQFLWHAGESAGHLCLVTEGLLQASVVAPSGKASIIEIIVPGNICGCRPYFCGGKVSCDVRAITDAAVQCVPISAAFEFGKNNPAWFEQIARNLALRFTRQISLRSILADGARRKVPGILLWLRESTGEIIPLTQSAIAMVAGLTEETVCREPATLKRKELAVVSRGGIRLADPVRLKRYLEAL